MNSLKWEHLIDSKYYIKTWIYNAAWMRTSINTIFDWDFSYVDYYRANKNVAKENLSSSNNNSFVISKIDSSNKYSKEYLNCTWVVAIWEDKKTWENISFLSHQNVISFLRDKRWLDEEFKNKLQESINNLIEKSKDWTLDFIIVWWNDFDEYREYKETIKFLDSIIFELTGINPSVVWWPTVNNKAWKENNKDVILLTEDRRVYLFKKYSEVSENINFVANEVDKIIES
jgi:hypothetical protein